MNRTHLIPIVVFVGLCFALGSIGECLIILGYNELVGQRFLIGEPDVLIRRVELVGLVLAFGVVVMQIYRTITRRAASPA